MSDPLERSDAIVVLGGDMPFRTLAAARLYRERWAPEVWLTLDADPDRGAAFARLGIRFWHEEVYNRQVLEHEGVPRTAVRLLDHPAVNTVHELRVAGEELRRQHGHRVIVVTSKPHTRRVRATWHVLFADLDIRVQHPVDDPYDADRWWHQTRGALAVSREVFGLLNVWRAFR